MADPIPVSVRAATPEDMPQLGRMGERLCRDHHELDPDRFFILDDMAPGYGRFLARELENEAVVLLVAEVEGRIAGYAYGRMEDRDWNSLRDACAVGVDLYVAPDLRDRGIGRRLCEALVRAFEQRGAPRVVVHAAARNERAVAFYESLGFRPTMVELTRERSGGGG
jgi:ribosomal protein S18 acetylase RimI-like enzyme